MPTFEQLTGAWERFEEQTGVEVANDALKAIQDEMHIKLGVSVAAEIGPLSAGVGGQCHMDSGAITLSDHLFPAPPDKEIIPKAVNDNGMPPNEQTPDGVMLKIPNLDIDEIRHVFAHELIHRLTAVNDNEPISLAFEEAGAELAAGKVTGLPPRAYPEFRNQFAAMAAQAGVSVNSLVTQKLNGDISGIAEAEQATANGLTVQRWRELQAANDDAPRQQAA